MKPISFVHCVHLANYSLSKWNQLFSRVNRWESWDFLSFQLVSTQLHAFLFGSLDWLWCARPILSVSCKDQEFFSIVALHSFLFSFFQILFQNCSEATISISSFLRRTYSGRLWFRLLKGQWSLLSNLPFNCSQSWSKVFVGTSAFLLYFSFGFFSICHDQCSRLPPSSRSPMVLLICFSPGFASSVGCFWLQCWFLPRASRRLMFIGLA